MGASTGRDGIGGASVLASAELGRGRRGQAPERADRRPFEEKKLLECCLELLERGLLVALQDLGAAGLTSSSSEMASKGGVGIELDVARVPLREPDMEPFEIMISESQERMLAVVRARARSTRCSRSARSGRRAPPPSARSPPPAAMRVSATADGWWATCPSRRWSTTARSTTSRPPGRRRRSTRAPPRDARGHRSRRGAAGAAGLAPTSRRGAGCMSSTTAMVQSRTVRRPEQADAAVLALPSGGALAVSIDGNGRRVACDPYRGAVEAVLECAANLACVGAEPLGLTNCLNFGNPEKPHVAWQLGRAVEGMADACRALGRAGRGRQRLALQRGRRRAHLPDPGRGDGGRAARRRARRAPGLRARGATRSRWWARAPPSLAGSELAKLRGEPLAEELPALDLGAVRRAHAAVREAVRSGALDERPRRRRGRPGGRARRVLHRRRRGRAGSSSGRGRRAALFGEGPGAFVVVGARARRWPPSAGGARSSAPSGGDALEIAGALSVPVAELAAAQLAAYRHRLRGEDHSGPDRGHC